MRRLFAGAFALLGLSGCNSAPQSAVDAGTATPVTPPTQAAAPPSRIAHEGTRIGAVFFPVSPGSAAAPETDSDGGLIVGSVVAGGAAAKAGIVKGDVLLSVDGTPVNSLADLTAAVNAAAPHHSAEFEMSRDSETRKVTIPL